MGTHQPKTSSKKRKRSSSKKICPLCSLLSSLPSPSPRPTMPPTMVSELPPSAPSPQPPISTGRDKQPRANLTASKESEKATSRFYLLHFSREVALAEL